MRRLSTPPLKKPRIAQDNDTLMNESQFHSECRIALVRAPIMAILQVEEGPKILFQPFKSPLSGHTPGISDISLKKTLGCRTKITQNIFRNLSQFKTPPSLDSNESVEDIEYTPLILYTPNESDPLGKHVKVDPMLARWLREHQRQGVQFIFDCLMGLKSFDGEGCILADDMGLGKTLQSITIMWTLLKQGLQGKPSINRCLIVCPASLVNNWASEINKWLKGKCPCTPVADSSKDKVVSKFLGFKYDHQSKVLISSYETFRMHVDKLQDTPIELIICDEAHRLKNERTKIAVAISKLSARKRLLLSGTPIQNDLDEFFAMISLCNPDLLGEAIQFRKNYANPITQGREPNSSEDQQELATKKLNELSAITNLFVLRRTNNLLAKVLPPKIVLNIFCKLTPIQIILYENFIDSKSCKSLLQTDSNAGLTGRALSSIQGLMKLCNHPLLLRSNSKTIPGFESCNEVLNDIENLSKTVRIRLSRPDLSGKLLLVKRLLYYFRNYTKDRVVIISNFTQTLDLFDRLSRENGYPLLRLDGSTSIKKRHSLVNEFNDPCTNNFIFLLSSKAGGCGINLIGANRLIMYDPDWNPANDKQALARIWRDGQKKDCFIYRLFSSGTIEEKVYQRQICKEGLSTMLMSEGQCRLKDSIAEEMLKDLFTLRKDTNSDTHDMLGCSRCSKDKNQNNSHVSQLEKFDEDDLLTWGHHHDLTSIPDLALISSTTRRSDKLKIFSTKPEINHSQLSDEDFQPVTFVMSCTVKLKPFEQQEREDKTQSENISSEKELIIDKENCLPTLLHNSQDADSDYCDDISENSLETICSD